MRFGWKTRKLAVKKAEHTVSYVSIYELTGDKVLRQISHSHRWTFAEAVKHYLPKRISTIPGAGGKSAALSASTGLIKIKILNTARLKGNRRRKEKPVRYYYSTV